MTEELSDAFRSAADPHVMRQGGEEVTIHQGYRPPLDGRPDLVDEFDMRIARGVAECLVRTYFGYGWKVTADSQQGVVYFQIPDLMGPTLNYIIRLAQYSDLTPELIIKCGGELLERMGLPRGPLDMALYLNAKQNMDKFDFGDVKGRKK